jgi:DNA polymerase-3 subunit beta
MKILCSKDTLLTGVNTVQRAVSLKSTLPVLQGILLQAAEQTLSFTATDLEIAIHCEVPAEIETEGSAVVPARLFADIVRKLPDTVISLELNDDVLTISYLQSVINLKNYDPGDFPSLPDLKDMESFTLPTVLFKDMIRQTVFACATEVTRPIFTGILLNIEGRTIRMVATDTHRLAYRVAEMSEQEELHFSGLVPAKTMSEISKLIRDEDEVLQISCNNSQISFRFGSVYIISRLIDGQFPNYNQVIPQSCETKIVLPVKSLWEAVERASLIARDNNASIIRMTIEEQILTIDKTTEIGKIREQLDIFKEGQDINITFNAKFLSDVLRVIDHDEITVEFSGSYSPGVIRSVDNPDYLYLLLPVRTI